MRLLQFLAPVCFICQTTFTAQVQTHVETLGCTASHDRHPSPIVIERLDLKRAYAAIEDKTVKSVESSPSTSTASSSSPSSARSHLNTHSPLDSKLLEADAAVVQVLPESTASSASLVQRIAEVTLVLTTPATTSAQTTARAESEARTERALDRSDALTREPLHSHMSFGDPEFDPSVASIPLTTDTFTLFATHVPDVTARFAPTENQDFEIPESLQKGMIGYNTAQRAVRRHSQS